MRTLVSRRVGFAIATLGLTSLLAGCGASNNVYQGLPFPVAAAAAQPFSVSTTAPASNSVSIPAGGGFSGTFGVTGTVAAGTTQTQILSSSAPSGLPILALARHVAGVSRAAQSVDPSQVIVYLAETFSADLATNGVALAIQVPTAKLQPATAYYLALFDPVSAAWQTPFEGPATQAGSTLTFSGNAPLTFKAATAYYFGVYGAPASAIATPTPVPTNVPTPVPTAVPTPVPTATPSPIIASVGTVNITTLGASGSKTFTASEASYAGVLSAKTANGAIATVTPSSGASGATFTVTGVSGGTTTIAITDTNGQSVNVSVTVTTGTVVVQ